MPSPKSPDLALHRGGRHGGTETILKLFLIAIWSAMYFIVVEPDLGSLLWKTKVGFGGWATSLGARRASSLIGSITGALVGAAVLAAVAAGVGGATVGKSPIVTHRRPAFISAVFCEPL